MSPGLTREGHKLAGQKDEEGLGDGRIMSETDSLSLPYR